MSRIWLAPGHIRLSDPLGQQTLPIMKIYVQSNLGLVAVNFHGELNWVLTGEIHSLRYLASWLTSSQKYLGTRDMSLIRWFRCSLHSDKCILKKHWVDQVSEWVKVSWETFKFISLRQLILLGLFQFDRSEPAHRPRLFQSQASAFYPSTKSPLYASSPARIAFVKVNYVKRIPHSN